MTLATSLFNASEALFRADGQALVSAAKQIAAMADNAAYDPEALDLAMLLIAFSAEGIDAATDPIAQDVAAIAKAHWAND
jgi:hypothetical protein